MNKNHEREKKASSEREWKKVMYTNTHIYIFSQVPGKKVFKIMRRNNGEKYV